MDKHPTIRWCACTVCVLIHIVKSVDCAVVSIAHDDSSPHIWSSVDDYRTVCEGEQVYLSCSAERCSSLSWTSLEHIGERTTIEFNENFDRLGAGKLVSLPNGGKTLLQLTETGHSLSSDVKIRISGNVNKTTITCTNNHGQRATKAFLLAEGSPRSPTCLPIETIAENATGGVVVYRFRWEYPGNIETIDLNHFQFQVDQRPRLALSNTTREVVLPLPYGPHVFNVVAVDRCNQMSPPTVCHYDYRVNPGLSNEPEDEVHLSEKSFSNRCSSANQVKVVQGLAYLITLSVSILLSLVISGS